MLNWTGLKMLFLCVAMFFALPQTAARELGSNQTVLALRLPHIVATLTFDDLSGNLTRGACCQPAKSQGLQTYLRESGARTVVPHHA
jgi:hypothetical protein